MKDPHDERYVRTDDFETKASSLEFPPEVWAVLARLESPSSAREIAAALLSTPDAVQIALGLLVQGGLVRKQAIGWNEFATRAKPLPAAVRAGGDAIVSIRISAQAPAAPAAVSLRLQTRPPAAAAAPAVPGVKLRPVLDRIAASAGGGVPGQLLLYKIFLQLPADRLKTAGVESLASIGPDFVLTDPLLRDALVAAVRQHTPLDVDALLSATP